MKAQEILQLHPLLSDRVRLAIMAALATSASEVDFSSLLKALELSKGNLSSHLRKLEDAGLIEVKKEFVERKPRSCYRCSSSGRVEVRRYLASLERALKGI